MMSDPQEEMERLRQRLAVLEVAFDLNPIPLQIFDEQGFSLRMNFAQQAFLGLPSVEAGVGTFNVLSDPFSIQTGNAAYFRRAYEEGVQLECPELKVDLGNATPRWGTAVREAVYVQRLLPVRASREPGAPVVAVVASLVEVTAVRLLEENLQRLTQSNADLADARRAAENTAVELARIGATLERTNSELEAAVAHRTRALAEANRELEAFNQAIAHDLRAPLRSIVSLIDAVLDEAEVDPGHRDLLIRAAANASRLEARNDALLRLSDMSRRPLVPEVFDLAAATDDAAAAQRLLAPERDVSLTIGPSVWVSADRALVLAALGQLLENAWRFTAHRPQAHVDVSFLVQGDWVHCTVRDDGLGFDQAYAHHLFEPFRRLHREDEGGRAGLDLVAVQRIVQRHGGVVGASGRPNEGAEISFTLPRAVS